MDWRQRFLFIAFVVLAAAIDGAEAYGMVTGTVFCDKCKDGQISLFDYPLHGIKVMISCVDSSGQITMSREETTNLFGNYAMKFDGTPDLSNCHAQVSGSGQGSNICGAKAGPAQKLKLMFRMFDVEMYVVDSLLSEPAQPMSFCPNSRNPVPAAPLPTSPPAPLAPKVPSPPFRLPPLPPLPRLPPLPPLPPLPGLPPLPPLPSLPPLPPLPPSPLLPPLPSLAPLPPVTVLQEGSACPHQNWKMQEYKCYWRVLNPDSKVAVVFGPIAAARYGTDITLWEGLHGRGDPYGTLLREATTALLNSYNSLEFPYHTLGVITDMNLALRGSTHSTLLTAWRFMSANSGFGRLPCKFTPCE
ncbi:hypothetical protein SLE2022_042710 [Rubroshorea leprosula]